MFHQNVPTQFHQGSNPVEDDIIRMPNLSVPHYPQFKSMMIDHLPQIDVCRHGNDEFYDPFPDPLSPSPGIDAMFAPQLQMAPPLEAGHLQKQFSTRNNDSFQIEVAPEIMNRLVTKTHQPSVYHMQDYNINLDEQTKTQSTCIDGPSYNLDFDSIIESAEITYEVPKGKSEPKRDDLQMPVNTNHLEANSTSQQNAPLLRVENEPESSVEVDSAKEANEKYAKSDPYLKKILRGFRKEIKDRFVAVYGTKYFHWMASTYRKRVKHFFTSVQEIKGKDGIIMQGYQFQEDFFDKNEAIFFSLINTTKKDKGMEEIGIQLSPFTKVMQEVFGQKPNQKNLKEFFKNEVIQELWKSAVACEGLKKIVRETPNRERMQLNKLFDRVSPAEFEVLPCPGTIV